MTPSDVHRTPMTMTVRKAMAVVCVTGAVGFVGAAPAVAAPEWGTTTVVAQAEPQDAGGNGDSEGSNTGLWGLAGLLGLLGLLGLKNRADHRAVVEPPAAGPGSARQ